MNSAQLKIVRQQFAGVAGRSVFGAVSYLVGCQRALVGFDGAKYKIVQEPVKFRCNRYCQAYAVKVV